MISKSLVFHGKVQGVGFRYFVTDIARDLEITGWVRNEYDGTVSAEITGQSENIELFLNKVKDGPRFGFVKKIDISDLSNVIEYKNFNIRY